MKRMENLYVILINFGTCDKDVQEVISYTKPKNSKIPAVPLVTHVKEDANSLYEMLLKEYPAGTIKIGEFKRIN